MLAARYVLESVLIDGDESETNEARHIAQHAIELSRLNLCNDLKALVATLSRTEGQRAQLPDWCSGHKRLSSQSSAR